MKERPIIFSGDMVRAILDGRKTQTRRVVKPRPAADFTEVLQPDDTVPNCIAYWMRAGEPLIGDVFAKSPYGQIGDRLWVRETFRLSDSNDCSCYEPCRCRSGTPMYRADGHYHDLEYKWRPSIYMPRWASRITLEVTAVRVERLQDISEEDAIAEGVESCYPSQSCGLAYRDYLLKYYDPFEWYGSPVDSFQSLWESINGPGSWDANPWVWVIEFKRILGNGEG